MILFYIECVFMKILFRNHRETFFSLFLEARFAPCLGLLKFRVTKTQPELLYAKSAASGHATLLVCSIVRFLHLCVFAGLTLFLF